MSSFVKEYFAAKKESKRILSETEEKTRELVQNAKNALTDQINAAEKEAMEKNRNALAKAEADCEHLKEALRSDLLKQGEEKIESAKEHVNEVVEYLVEKAKSFS